MSGYATIDILEVCREYRGLGVGRSLVDHFLRYSRQREQMGVYVRCWPETSVPFWKKLGFCEADHLSTSSMYTNVHLFRSLPGCPDEIDGDVRKVSISITDIAGKLLVGPFPNSAVFVSGVYHLKSVWTSVVDDIYACVRICVDDSLVYQEKIKYVEDIGGLRDGPFVELRQFQLPQ